MDFLTPLIGSTVFNPTFATSTPWYMSLWNGIKGIGSFIGNGIKNLLGLGAGNIATDLYNIYQQQLNNERTMAYNDRLLERDDTSLARLMKQYEENNINPLLAVPNVSSSTTKGFETSAVQSHLDTQAMAMAHEQYKLNKERQELELDIMRDQNRRANEEHNRNLITKDFENQILKSKLNGAKAYAKIYGSGLGFDEEGYIPPFAMTSWEKILSGLASGLKALGEKADKTFSFTDSRPADLVDNLQSETVTKEHPYLHPNTYTFLQ